MQPTKLRTAHVSHIIMFVSVVAVALIFVGCKATDTTKNVNVPPTPTPSPSPTPSSSPGFQLLPGDTIIVIKDGSVKIRVNKTLCLDDDDPAQPNDKKYKCENVELKSVSLETDLAQINTPPIGTNSKITIDGGGGKDVEIKGNPNANPKNVTIKFKKAHYPKCDLPNEHEHLGTNQVGTVKIDSVFTRACNPTEHCELTVTIRP